MSILMLSLSKAARAAPRPSSALLSTNAAINHQVQAQAVQDFWESATAAIPLTPASTGAIAVADTSSSNGGKKRLSQENGEMAKLQKCARDDLFKHFRMSAASRAVKRGADGVVSKYFSLNDAVASRQTYPASRGAVEDTSPHWNGGKHLSQEEGEAAMLQQCAREDAFKHFRMSAASRAMKRGDGIMSKYFSLDDQVKSRHQYGEGDNALYTELPSPIDVATARKAREEMHNHFWSSHQARKNARNDTEARLPFTNEILNATSAHHGKHHVHEHRFKLPTTLDDVYIEFGSSLREMKHKPRPMAITESDAPFQIVDVNKAWTKLCGYTREEAVESTLQELLQGPDTNVTVAKILTTSLLRQENGNSEHEAVLVNYRSDGRKFRNHVRVGRIKNDAGDTTHFVGVFRKLSDGEGTSHEDLYENV